jgi:serine/threonine protein kinase
MARPLPTGAFARPEREAPPVAPAAPTSRPERSLGVGDVLRSRYRVLGVLGQGGMGTVYDAVDQFRVEQAPGDQRVAIKVLHSAVTHQPRLFSELRREFQHLQSLSHPNIVRVHEFDRDGDIAFFTMERLSGSQLNRVLAAHRSSPLFRPYALAIIRDVGAAVAHAHAHGVVHGDLNPVNIFITENGESRVLDFGAAHQLRRGPWISDFENTQQMAVATPSYASCQLLEGETADVRDDIYGLACVSYVLLTGKHPYRELNALKARSARMKPARPAGLSRRQWQALRSALDFSRANRPSDIEVWLDELGVRAPTRLPSLPALFKPRLRRRHGKKWAVAAALTCIAAAAAWAALRPDAAASSWRAVSAKLSAAAEDTGLTRLWNEAQHVALDNGPGAKDLASPAPPQDAPTPATPPPAIQSAPPAAAKAHTRTAPKDTQPAAPPTTPATPNNSTAPTPAATAATALNSATPSPAARSMPNAGSAQPPSSGRARVELAADTVDVVPGDPMARVTVRRSRTMRGDVTFNWWTESGTAKPGRDFVAVKPAVEHIADGKNAVSLLIPVVMDPKRRDSRSFYVVIDAPSDNAALGPRTLTMVTMPGAE